MERKTRVGICRVRCLIRADLAFWQRGDTVSVMTPETPAPVHPLVRFVPTTALLLSTLWATGCAHRVVKVDDRFWLRATPSVKVSMRPALGSVAPGDTKRFTVAGTVQGQYKTGDGGYRLVLKRPDAVMTYRIGGGRKFPLRPGAQVRILLFIRQHAADPEIDLGFLLYARVSGGGGQRPSERLIAAVQDNGVLSPTLLPEALHAVKPTDVIAYHHGLRRDATCDELYEHRYFRLLRPSLLAGSDAKTPDGRLFGPGSRLRVYHTGKSSYDLMLVDNRSVSRSNCRARPGPRWTWSAIWLPN